MCNLVVRHVSLFFLVDMNLILIGVILYLHIKAADCMLCGIGWLEFEGKCYLQFNSNLTWHSAALTCTTKDVPRQLVTVDTTLVNTFLQTNLINEEKVWIGLGFGKRVFSQINSPWQWNYNITEYNWTWSDGTALTYSNWNDASVKSACVLMTNAQTWYTQLCTFQRNFVCEKEMVNDTCNTKWLAHQTHCYLFVNTPKHSCMAAARFCWDDEAYLLSINNQEEANFVYQEIAKSADTEYWIGLSPFSWSDSTPYQWNNWDDDGPSIINKCTFINQSTGRWSAGDCEGPERNRFICQKDILFPATIDIMTTTYVNEQDVMTNNYSYKTDIFAYLDKTTISVPYNEAGLSQKVIFTTIVPAVAGMLVIIIVILVVIVIVLRRKRSSKPTIEAQVPTNKIDEYDTSLDVYDAIDSAQMTDNSAIKIPSTNAHGQETIIYDTTELVQGPTSTIVVNGDVYAIVDKDKPGNNKMKDSNNTIQDITKDGISKGQSHIVVGTDVYAIVDKEKVKANKQNRPKQKNKKPASPPKLENESDEINSIGQNHIVVGSDVYAIVDKDNRTPNNQKKPKQKKKKPAPLPKLEDKSDEINTNGQNHILDGSDVYAIVDIDKVTSNNQTKPKQKKKKQETPPKLEDKEDKMDEGNVYYNEFNMNTVPLTPTKHNAKGKDKDEEMTGIVYADLDLTGPGPTDGACNDEEAGVVYSDVRH